MRGKGKAVDRSGLRPLRSNMAYKIAIAEVDRLWNAKPGTPEHDRLEVLGILVDAYEAEAVKFHMEQAGRTQADLARLLGSASRASEVLRRKRRMTIEMAWQLHREWGIPADCLLRPYELAA